MPFIHLSSRERLCPWSSFGITMLRWSNPTASCDETSWENASASYLIGHIWRLDIMTLLEILEELFALQASCAQAVH